MDNSEFTYVEGLSMLIHSCEDRMKQDAREMAGLWATQFEEGLLPLIQFIDKMGLLYELKREIEWKHDYDHIETGLYIFLMEFLEEYEKEKIK
ncbi:hypothetical protein P5667_15645 [Bacillus velezensis]|uniref:hypothetical protein n=1 Tax=Bacillus velezensis TaxID=492670 RepID=UPI00279C7DD2|nr:hypothetical protein [Bacillus velezensis]WEY80397.1 hypothetical protein P5667_15645 [Bacillus velezensis]